MARSRTPEHNAQLAELRLTTARVEQAKQQQSEQLLAAYRSGITYAAMAEALGVTPDAISQRIKVLRKRING